MGFRSYPHNKTCAGANTGCRRLKAHCRLAASKFFLGPETTGFSQGRCGATDRIHMRRWARLPSFLPAPAAESQPKSVQSRAPGRRCRSPCQGPRLTNQRPTHHGPARGPIVKKLLWYSVLRNGAAKNRISHPVVFLAAAGANSSGAASATAGPTWYVWGRIFPTGALLS